MPDEYTILTVHTSVAKEPDDVWLETTVEAQARAILRESTRPTASPIHVSPVLVFVREKGGTDAWLPAHFSREWAIIHVIPLRLPVGTNKIEVLLTGEIWAQPDFVGTPSVELRTRMAGVTQVSNSSVVVTDTSPMPVDLSLNIEPVQLEVVQDLIVEMRSSRSEDSFAGSDLIMTGEGGFISAFGTPLLLRYGADTFGYIFPNDDSSDTVNEGFVTLVNGGDSMSSTRPPDYSVRVYDSNALPAGRLSLLLYSLAGWWPKSIRIGTKRRELNGSEVADLTVGFRANIPASGALAGQVSLDVEAAQDTPRLLLALPGCDELNDDDEVWEPRKWKVASAENRTVLQACLNHRRDYGKLEVQLRLLILNGSDYAASPVDLSEAPETWEAPEDNTMFSVNLWQLFTGDTPDVAFSSPVGTFSSGDLRIYPAVRGSTRFPVLRDLGRYAQGRTYQRLRGVSRFESGAGFRDGMLHPEETVMLNTVAFNIELDSIGSDEDLMIAIELDRDGLNGFWTQFPGALVACVGASITWDGR